MNEEKIIAIISEDPWMMNLLQAAKTLNLPDWWICAGFVRSKIWDTIHHFKERTPIPDIDVIYFDTTDLNEAVEKELEENLHSLLPTIPWSVKNEARMHLKSQMPPYSSSVDAISKFPETATALGVKLDDQGQVVLTAPCGISDVVHLVVKPTSFFTKTKEHVQMYEERITKKNWKATWPQLKVMPIERHYEEGESLWRNKKSGASSWGSS